MAPSRGWISLYFVAFASYSTTSLPRSRFLVVTQHSRDIQKTAARETIQPQIFGLICQFGVYNQILK